MRRILQISLVALLSLVFFRPAAAQVGISINIGTPVYNVGFAPPPIPEYEQPPCPEEGVLWTPGFWNWDEDDADYYWVPGTWVMPPQPGLLWTPAYWGWDNGAYGFHDGYWGSEVGFYGGVNYGYGYYGEGFRGGRWDNGRFMYNTAVLRVNPTVVRTVYVDRTVIVNNNGPRVSYNGGNGGTNARPTQRDEQVAHARHFPPAQPQLQHRQAARTNPQLRASANQGKPPIAATAKPGDFKGPHVMQAKAAGGNWHPPADRRAAAKAHNGSGDNARPGENNRPGNDNAHPGAMNGNNRPGNDNARPGNQNARPGDITRPGNDNAHPGNQNARPGNENARPGENNGTPQRPQPNRDNQMNQPRQQQERPQARPQQEQNRPQERPQQARPQQERPQQQRPPADRPQQPE